MHLAVVGSTESWYLTDLRRAAGDRHTLVPLAFRQLTAESGQRGECFLAAGGDLRRFDAVLIRSMPPGSLEQVVFRMDVLGRLEAAGTVVINPPRAIEAAVDKYLATARLQAAGLVVPRTIVCQTVDDAMLAFEELGGDVVIKPLFGSEGRGIARLTDEALARRAFQLIAGLGGVLYLQQFIAHAGHDLRLLVLGDEVLAMRRRNPHDWRTNVARGATAEAFRPDGEMIEIARRAAAAVGAPLAGVDLLPGRDGRLYAIEVNAVPGWKALAAALKIDVAAQILGFIGSLVASGSAANNSRKRRDV
jgi:ribosomal protein S6--L-glutamate ligase